MDLQPTFVHTHTHTIMAFYQEQHTNKQRINFILDNSDEVIFQNKIPEINTQQKTLSFKYESNETLIKRLPSPFESEEQQQQQEYFTNKSMPPTAQEMQYIKRIHALMTLVSKQTKEIHSLREIISSFNNNEHDFINDNRKRNKQSS